MAVRASDRAWLVETGNLVAYDARVMGLRTAGMGLTEAREQAYREIRPDAPKSVPKPSVQKREAKRDDGELKCDYDASIEWVAARIDKDDVKYEDRPSDTAWSMLQWAKSSGTAQQAFWTTIYSKLAPAKAERELAALMADDMKANAALVARVLALARRAEDAQ